MGRCQNNATERRGDALAHPGGKAVDAEHQHLIADADPAIRARKSLQPHQAHAVFGLSRTNVHHGLTRRQSIAASTHI